MAENGKKTIKKQNPESQTDDVDNSKTISKRSAVQPAGTILDQALDFLRTHKLTLAFVLVVLIVSFLLSLVFGPAIILILLLALPFYIWYDRKKDKER